MRPPSLRAPLSRARALSWQQRAARPPRRTARPSPRSGGAERRPRRSAPRAVIAVSRAPPPSLAHTVRSARAAPPIPQPRATRAASNTRGWVSVRSKVQARFDSGNLNPQRVRWVSSGLTHLASTLFAQLAQCLRFLCCERLALGLLKGSWKVSVR